MGRCLLILMLLLVGCKQAPPSPTGRFLAVLTSKRLKLFAIHSDGRLGLEPASELNLQALRLPYLTESRLIRHPRLNVFYLVGADKSAADGEIRGYRWDAAGKLMPLEGNPIRLVGASDWRGTCDPMGRHLYLFPRSDAGVRCFGLDHGGEVSPRGRLALKVAKKGGRLRSLIAGRPGSDSLYGVRKDSLLQLVVDADGMLQPRSTAPSKEFANFNLMGFSENGRFLRLSDWQDRHISVRVDAHGQLFDSKSDDFPVLWPLGSGFSVGIHRELLYAKMLTLYHSKQEVDSQLAFEEAPVEFGALLAVDRPLGSIYLTWANQKDGTCCSRYVLYRGRLSAQESRRRLGPEGVLYSVDLLETKPAP